MAQGPVFQREAVGPGGWLRSRRLPPLWSARQALLDLLILHSGPHPVLEEEPLSYRFTLGVFIVVTPLLPARSQALY